MAFVAGCLMLLLVVFVVAWVADERVGRIAAHTRKQQARLRIRHEQFLAERRLQRLTQAALQQMLDTARSDQSIRDERHRS